MVAEELVYGPTVTSTGSGSDLRAATELVRRLVSHLGGSATVGPVATDVIEQGDASDRGSEAMRTMVWADVHSEAIAAMTVALHVLAPRVGQLEAFADLLVAAEDVTLSGAKLQAALGGLVEPLA